MSLRRHKKDLNPGQICMKNSSEKKTFPTFAGFSVSRKSILASTNVRSVIVGASCIDVRERDRIEEVHSSISE